MPELLRHRQRLTLLALLLAAGALWVASRLTWVQVRTADDLRGVRSSALTGEAWTAELVPLALTVLAAVAAALALRGLALRAVGAVLVVIGVLAAVPGGQLLIEGASAERAAGLVTPPALAAHATTTTSLGGPVLALLGALLTLVAAGSLLSTPRAARGLPSRYQSPAVLKEEAAGVVTDLDDEVSERLLWDAMDAGRDPTADPADSQRSRPPPPPVGDPHHYPDSVGDDQPSETTRGACGHHERS
ncbi:MAG: TIGR02234 family membrane protein [Mycobacteriaceae bacterium]